MPSPYPFENHKWKQMTVSPDDALSAIDPGMVIFLGTGAAEPRTLVRRLMQSTSADLQDLELVQLVSLADAVSPDTVRHQNYRLKTFFSGWVASEAIHAGRVDLIPSRFSRIPLHIATGRVHIDVAMVQVSPPDADGNCSLGIAVDVARHAMARADRVIGEINPWVPRTYGDTFISIDDFDHLVASQLPPMTFERWPVDDVFDRVAANVASVIEDGSCLGFSIGPLFEALGRHLQQKRGLGVHSPFITDALMELIRSGAVTNRHKGLFQGKSVVSYAFGSQQLLDWLHCNPLVEFQSIDKVFSPTQIGKNRRFVTTLPARKVDLAGRIALHAGKGNVAAGPGEAIDFVNGAELSHGGLTVFALPSRNLRNEPNIRLSVEDMPNLFSLRESVDMIVTDYGVASISGRTARERAQALIDVAHPEDRQALVDQAKADNILYPDQIFIAESAHLYPSDIAVTHTFRNNIRVRFRAIRPSDEEAMRRLFYRFSDEAVYYRYFTAVKTMPHAKMQSYVNVDYRRVLSIVGVVGDPGHGHIIAEARYIRLADRPYADVAFVVDGEYEGLGIATFMYRMLIRRAREQGLQGFTADVLASNKAMVKVFEKGGYPVRTQLSNGAYELTIPFEDDSPRP